MITSFGTFVLVTAFSTVAALAVSGTAAAQSESQQQQGSPGMHGVMGHGMGGMMGSQGGMMQGCPMMRGAGSMSGHSMPHLGPGNEKLEMQMHADVMRAIADVMTKYAARLPERK
jgi:hypothetical protein